MATVLGRLTFRGLNRLGILKRVMRRENLDYMEEQTMQMEALDLVKVESPGAAVMAPDSWDAERKRLILYSFYCETIAGRKFRGPGERKNFPLSYIFP